METGKKCLISGCMNIAIARDLCQMHYKRWLRHGDVLPTRASDWGARERHPLYRCWNGLMRFHRAETDPIWHDLWKFVADIGETRPSAKHLLKRIDGSRPYGPANVYWKEPRNRHRDEKKTAAENMRVWRAANPHKHLNIEFRRRYGITLDDYERMFAEQKGVCAICACLEVRVDHRTKKASRLAVDHCHKTGAVRGLLCHSCNNGLGALGDDPARLRAALAYLERHQPSA